jgi:hypothetical protein
MYRWIVAVGIGMATCLAIGCGGSDAAAPLTKPQYRKQAEAICSRINKETEKAAAAWKEGFPGGVAEAEENPDNGLRKVLIPSIEREAGELEALEPPAKDKAIVAKFVGELARAPEVLAARGFKALPESGVIEFRQEASAYGLKSCGGAL